VIKAGYKQTEVGVIPEDWDIKKVGSICNFIVPGRNKPKVFNGDICWVTTPDLQGKFIVVDSHLKITKEVAKSVGSKVVPKNSVIMTCVGDLGIVAITGVEMVINQQLHAFLPNENIDYYYLYFAISIQKKYMEEVATKTAVPYMNKNNCNSIPIAIPPTKTEQTAIAKALSDTDALIQSLKQLIAKKRQIKQGAMQSLLNPYDAMGALKAGWEVKKLGDVLKIGHGRSQYQVISLNGQYPILASGGEIGRATSFLYDKPSVLIGRKGTIDVPQYMDKPFWTIDTLFYSEILKPNNAKYIFYQFCLIDWYSYNEASGVPSLSAKTIENIDIVMSPSNEQTQIAKILTDMDTEITALETKLSKYQKIKQGMMQNLLTGRIRLITPSLQAGNKTS